MTIQRKSSRSGSSTTRESHFVQSDPAPTTTAPTISVIIPTYNRSQTLRHAIQSVCNSSLTDWELIVVGDACTDDTAQCVSSFNNPRIRFVNLASRCGDQSGPNNHGIALSRGRYLAFLNHDDFYLPDHLAACVAELESSGADLVWVPCAVAHPKAAPVGERPFSFALQGVPATSEYSPMATYFASSWVLRRDLADRVGAWRSPDRIYIVPSQDWLFRAWRSGASGSRLTFESGRGFPADSNACEFGACEPEFPSLSSLRIAAV